MGGAGEEWWGMFNGSTQSTEKEENKEENLKQSQSLTQQRREGGKSDSMK